MCVCVYRKEDEAISRKYIKDNNKKKKREMQLAPGRIWQIGCCAVCKREKDEKNAARRGGYIIRIIKRLDHSQATAGSHSAICRSYYYTHQPTSQPAAKRGYIQPPPYIIGGEKSLRQRHLFLHCVALFI